MIVILLVIHVLVILALVGVVLMQKSEGGALGIGGGGGGMSGFMTGRSTSNLLTRATAVLAAVFMMTSVALVWLSNQHPSARSILNTGTKSAPVLPAIPGTKTPPVPGAKLPAIPGTKLPPVSGAKGPAAPNSAPPSPAAPKAPPAH